MSSLEKAREGSAGFYNSQGSRYGFAGSGISENGYCVSLARAQELRVPKASARRRSSVSVSLEFQ